jgi:hypothetical protein
MVLLSNTAFQSAAPSTQNGAVGFPQQLSLFLAGGWASHFGGLAQVTYSHASDHFSMDIRPETSSSLKRQSVRTTETHEFLLQPIPMG